MGRFRFSTPFLVLCLVCLSFVSLTRADNPGLRASISQSFLDYVNTLAPLFLDIIARNLTLPNLAGNFTIPVAGLVKWELTKIHFHELFIGHSKTVIQQGQIVESIVGAKINLQAHYSWVSPQYADNGNVTILIDGVNIGFNVEVGEYNGRPTVASSDCEFAITNVLNFTFYGKIAWIYNDLANAMDPVIVFLVQKLVPILVEDAINVIAEEALMKLRVIVPDGDYLIDFTMLGPPYWAPDNSYFSFAVKGMYEPKAHPQACPYPAAVLPYSLSNDMLQVYVGDYFVNCASWAHYEVGFLHRIFDPTTVPDSARQLIETNTYHYIIPPLYQKYPDHFMSVAVYATQIPSSSFATTGVSFNGLGQLDASVIVGNTLVPAFSIKLTLSLQVEVHINDTTNYIFGQIGSMMCDMSLINSPIGPFDFSLLEAFLVGTCQYLVPTAVNIYMENFGIPIPSFQGFSAVNPQVLYGNGYVGVATSLKWSPGKK
jgi:hypothetical protein